MKSAVFADIHGNLEAFEAFLVHSAKWRVDRYIFLGDAVGYGANPDECLTLLRSLKNLTSVLGNHDAAVLWKSSPYQMNRYALEVILWTLEQLQKENVDFLDSLACSVVEEKVCFCHSVPQQPQSWLYLNSKNRALSAFSETEFALSFVGHTHIPLIFSQKMDRQIHKERVEAGESRIFSEPERLIINCGSIGQPRDGLTQGAYCLYDEEERSVVFQRFDYDYETTAAKIIAAGLPEYLASRLRYGL